MLRSIGEQSGQSVESVLKRICLDSDMLCCRIDKPGNFNFTATVISGGGGVKCPAFVRTLQCGLEPSVS